MSELYNNWHNWQNWNSNPIPLTTHKVPSDNNIQFFVNNGILEWENSYNADEILRVYQLCTPVSSIIDNMADAFVNGDMLAMNARTENTVRGVNKEWQRLIDNPNWMQDQSQFFKQLYTYRKMWGWCYVLKIKPVGFDTPSELWCLPPWLLTVTYIEQGFYLTDKGLPKREVRLNWGGQQILLDNDDLILFTDNTNIFNRTNWLPLPRIYTKRYSMTLLLSILEAETTLVQNKGALGIISNDQGNTGGIPIPMSPEQKDDMQRQWNKYGLTRAQFQMIFTNARVSYTPLVFDSAQLELKPGYLNAYKDVADGLHYPFILTAHSDNSTYNNVQWAQKVLYQDAIIPDAKSIFRTLEQGTGAMAANVTFWHKDMYGDLDAFQVGNKEKAEARKWLNEAMKIEWDNGLISRNEWLSELGEDTKSDPMFDKTKFELTPEEMGIIMQNNGNDAGKVPAK